MNQVQDIDQTIKALESDIRCLQSNLHDEGGHKRRRQKIVERIAMYESQLDRMDDRFSCAYEYIQQRKASIVQLQAKRLHAMAADKITALLSLAAELNRLKGVAVETTISIGTDGLTPQARDELRMRLIDVVLDDPTEEHNSMSYQTDSYDGPRLRAICREFDCTFSNGEG